MYHVGVINDTKNDGVIKEVRSGEVGIRNHVTDTPFSRVYDGKGLNGSTNLFIEMKAEGEDKNLL